MIAHFLKLEWKQYFRSSYWQKSIFLNILLGFFALYFMASFLIIGIDNIEYNIDVAAIDKITK